MPNALRPWGQLKGDADRLADLIVQRLLPA